MKSIIFILVPISVYCNPGVNVYVKEYSYVNQPGYYLRASNEKSNYDVVKYYLYTKINSNKPFIIESSDINRLSNATSPFNPKTKNIFLIHGWTNSFNSTINQLLKNVILNRYDFNVFVCDWSPVSKQNYLKAARAVSRIGTYIGNFINFLILHFDQSGSEFILIGHSLGAHVAGNAGSVTIVPVDHIIGLDPAGPLFNYINSVKRLNSKHAQYVQVIHTNALTLGYGSSVGHVDYYPNGGMVQTGCSVISTRICSHSRAYEFLAEAIKDGSNFIAVKCKDYIDFKDGKCDRNEKSRMGLIFPNKTVLGDFYLETNGHYPFAKG